MEIATGAIETVLAKLANLLKEEYKLQKSIRDKIRSLEKELKAMEIALFEISMYPIDQPPNAQVKHWAREVRDLSYDLEDIVDKFLVRVDHAPEQLHGLRGIIDRKRNLWSKAKISHEIGIDIKGIKTRITEVSEHRDRYWIDHVPAKPTGPSVDSLRLSALNKMASEIIGTEENANDLVKILMEGDDPANTQPKVVSIVGIGGLGKTTLANVVYKRLKGQFDCGAFVSISQNPKMDRTFKSMLFQIERDRYSNINGETWDEIQLINELRDLLSNKRYFIVIDDIWNESVWPMIMGALNTSGRGSRIITTTRKLHVAEQTGYVYKLKALSPDDSRRLLYLRIFGSADSCLPKELAEKSENILRKCGGVPLAITTIGGVLANRKDESGNICDHWLKVYKAMGSGLETSSDMNNMRSILSVSYHDLPPHLRTCLLYLSLYPEDYVISTKDLILKWIGEGFIPKKQGKGMFEVGQDYICDLINRNLIQPSDIDDDSDNPRGFQIHDMVLDLITFLSNEEHFLTKLGAQEPEPLPSKVRRVSLQTSNEDDVKNLVQDNSAHVRSLIVFSESINLLPELSSFPMLRVLDIVGVQVGNHHWKCICNLFHLRYLGLFSKSITEIPKEIVKLKVLQVLDLYGTRITVIPSHIIEGRTAVTIPDCFGYLKSLQELIGRIRLDSPTTLQALGGLTELRSIDLVIKWDESYEKPFLSWLSNMVHLKNLIIIIDARGNLELGYRCDKLSPGPRQLKKLCIYGAMCSVPRWICSLCYLSFLHIYLVTLDEEGLEILGSIPSLSHLSISMKEPTQSGDKELLLVGNVYPFLCLTKFEIDNYMEVMFAQGAMKNLRNLKFRVLETMDQFGDSGFGLENLSSLENVSIDMCFSHANAKELEAAVTALQRAIDMNPNKPRMKLTKRCVLKLNVHLDERRYSKAMRSICELDDIEGVSVECELGKLTVQALVDTTTIIDKLQKVGIQAKPWEWDVMTPATSGIEQTATISETQ